MLTALALLAAAQTATPDPTATDDRADWLFTAVARTRPSGGLLGAEALLALDDARTLGLGGYLQYFYYWAEFGPKFQHTYLGGFLRTSVKLGLEPGDFIRSEDRASERRRPGLRAVAKTRLEVNYRPDWLWIYSRSTLEARVRTFEEYDPYRDATLRHELAFEQALAPLFRVLEHGDDGRIWLYVEGTVLVEASAGLLDLRPSGGVIWENPIEGVTFDLDVYRGLRKGPLEGWGVLLFVWWRI